MNNSRLYINDLEIPILRDVSIPTTYKIADIREPDKRDADTTLTIEIPSTKIIDEQFEFCFEVNLQLQNFNPNLKTPCEFWINNSRVLQGYLQLNRMIINPLTHEVIYFCNIKGQLSDLFYSIGEKFLTGNDNPSDDLDFSDYDHDLTKTKVLNTWDPSVSPNTNEISGVDTAVVAGVGYRYPLIDYGLNSGNVGDFYVHHQRPILFLREYLDKIFTMAGKTWTSTFLDGSFFKTLAIPCTEIVTRPAADIANNEAYVGTLTGINPGSVNLTFQVGPFNWDSPLTTFYPKFDNDSTGGYSDPGALYNTGTGEITVAQGNDYIVSANFSLSNLMRHPSFTGDFYVAAYDSVVNCIIEEWDGVSWTPFVAQSISETAATHSDTYSVKHTEFNLTFNKYIPAGYKYRLRVDTTLTNVTLRKISDNSQIVTGSPYYDLILESYSAGVSVTPFFQIILSTTNIYEGDVMEVNQTIPRKIKQRDLLKSTINAFNLYVLPDKNDANNYFIEPRPTFFTTDYVDWTDKLDAGKGIEIIPMGELDAKQFKYKYKQGGDFFNKDYQDQWQEIYGEVTFESENEFVSGDKTTELIFSPTPLIGNDSNTLLIPKIYKKTNAVIEQTKDNIKLIQWGGVIGSSTWRLFTIAGFDSNWTDYPYAGHLDSPTSPTLDLCFGVPQYIYFNPSYTYPTTNIYTEYHYDFIRAITDKNSKIVVAYFNLDEVDIEFFDFRKQVFVNGSYYLVNAIIDFDALDSKTTKVELLKLL